MAHPAKSTTGPYQLLIVVRCKATEIYEGCSVSVAIHSTIAQFPTKAEADIAFANISEKTNSSGEYAVTKLYV